MQGSSQERAAVPAGQGRDGGTGVGRFSPRPHVVEAIQFTRALAREAVADRAGGPFGLTVCGAELPEAPGVFFAWVDLPDGQRADVGDWILRRAEGFHALGPEIFAATYEPAGLSVADQ